jgi:Exuperantia SAM-like domain
LHFRNGEKKLASNCHTLEAHCSVFSFVFSRRAVTFRRLLSEDKHDIESLQKAWDEGKRDAMAEIVKKLKDFKEEDHEELIELLDAHFDPEKKPVKPIVQRRESTSGGNGNGNGNGNRNDNRNDNGQMRQRRRRAPRGRSQNKENNGPRSDSRRKRSSDKRNSNQGNNNNNNNNMEQKSGAIRKEHHQQVDANQNPVMLAAN